MTDVDTHDPLRRYLEALPVPDASDGLFDRVERTRTRRRRIRRASIGALAMLTLALVLTPVLLPSTPDSRTLAEQSSATDRTLRSVAQRPEEAELRLIDRQLATAYSVAAPEGHIDTLWQRRQAAILRLEQEPIDARTVVSL